MVCILVYHILIIGQNAEIGPSPSQECQESLKLTFLVLSFVFLCLASCISLCSLPSLYACTLKLSTGEERTLDWTPRLTSLGQISTFPPLTSSAPPWRRPRLAYEDKIR